MLLRVVYPDLCNVKVGISSLFRPHGRDIVSFKGETFDLHKETWTYFCRGKDLMCPLSHLGQKGELIFCVGDLSLAVKDWAYLDGQVLLLVLAVHVVDLVHPNIGLGNTNRHSLSSAQIPNSNGEIVNTQISK